MLRFLQRRKPLFALLAHHNALKTIIPIAICVESQMFCSSRSVTSFTVEIVMCLQLKHG